MSLCLIAAGKITVIAATAFTLSWTHSAQKTKWQEDWRLTPAGMLEITEARIKGSGAGMEPPEGAVLENGWWTYRPDVPPRETLVLASSGATPSSWTLCAETMCIDVASPDNSPVTMSYCGETSPDSGLSQPR